MKILFVNPAPIIKYGIGRAFAEEGHEVYYVFLAREKSLDPFLNRIKPHYVFTEGGEGLFNKLFPLLEHRRIPHIYWAIEDPVDFFRLSLPYAKKSAHVFTPCIESIQNYQNQGLRAHLLMFACLPSYHRQVAYEKQYDHDIVFVGNNYSRHLPRLQGLDSIIRPLMQGKYDLKIYGNEWWLDPESYLNINENHYRGYLPNEKLSALCSSSKIILGLHSVNTSQTMMSMRTFEVLGSKGFYLTQWTPAIEYFFQNHYHLVWSKSAEETVDIVEFYLRNPEEREKIAAQGQKEVYQNHTYRERIKMILGVLNEKNQSFFYGQNNLNIKITRNKRIHL